MFLTVLIIDLLSRHNLLLYCTTLTNQKLFEELRDGIEQMRWAGEEEARSQVREVDALRGDIKRLNALREESLESQRKDLTKTFEGILYQREESFANKERDIAAQIVLLDSRFEQLQTENTRLKNELAAAQRKCEHYSEEVSGKEEVRRQLQWQLDDEQANRTQVENAHAHALQQVALELSMLKENASKDVADLKKKLGKVRRKYIATFSK